MAGYLGWRAKFGVTTPSVNAVVQPEYDDMRPDGVTNHLARMHIPVMPVESDADFSKLIDLIDAGVDEAIDRVMTVQPDVLILGISALAIWGGTRASCDALTDRMRRRAGQDIPVIHAGDAVPAALKAYGIDGGRISIMEPYYPVIEAPMKSFFEEHGFEIARYKHYRGRDPVGYSHVSAQNMIEGLKEVDSDDIDAIVQFGANLPMARLADEAERWLSKPVISINVATYWHALRTFGIDDKVRGFTRLLSEF